MENVKSPPELFDALFHSRVRLPSLPTTVVELVESLNSENSDVPGLVDKIGQDQSIVARVMRLANSSFYGFPGGVGSIREAVLMLGFNEVRNLVIATALMNLSPVRSRGFDWPNFWRQSFTVGVCARVLARRTRQNQEAAFLAGVVHDVGLLVVGICLPEQFSRVLEYQREHGVSMIEAEQSLWNTDHAKVGAAVARRWRFPEEICHAIENHHNSAPVLPVPLTDIVYVANLLCHEMALSDSGQEISAFLAEETHMRLGLDQKALEQVVEQIGQQDLGSILV